MQQDYSVLSGAAKRREGEQRENESQKHRNTCYCINSRFLITSPSTKITLLTYYTAVLVAITTHTLNKLANSRG